MPKTCVTDKEVTDKEVAVKQIEAYRQMTGEQRLQIGLQLYELSCDVARTGIRQLHLEATDQMVEEKLRQRIRLGYEIANQSSKSS